MFIQFLVMRKKRNERGRGSREQSPHDVSDNSLGRVCWPSERRGQTWRGQRTNSHRLSQTQSPSQPSNGQRFQTSPSTHYPSKQPSRLTRREHRKSNSPRTLTRQRPGPSSPRMHQSAQASQWSPILPDDRLYQYAVPPRSVKARKGRL